MANKMLNMSDKKAVKKFFKELADEWNKVMKKAEKMKKAKVEE